MFLLKPRLPKLILKTLISILIFQTVLLPVSLSAETELKPAIQNTTSTSEQCLIDPCSFPKEKTASFLDRFLGNKPLGTLAAINGLWILTQRGWKDFEEFCQKGTADTCPSPHAADWTCPALCRMGASNRAPNEDDTSPLPGVFEQICPIPFRGANDRVLKDFAYIERGGNSEPDQEELENAGFDGGIGPLTLKGSPRAGEQWGEAYDGQRVDRWWGNVAWSWPKGGPLVNIDGVWRNYADYCASCSHHRPKNHPARGCQAAPMDQATPVYPDSTSEGSSAWTGCKVLIGIALLGACVKFLPQVPYFQPNQPQAQGAVPVVLPAFAIFPRNLGNAQLEEVTEMD